MLHGVVGDGAGLGDFQPQFVGGVGVRFVELGAGAADGDPDAVPLVEDLADPPDVKRDGVDLPGLHEDLFLEAFAVAGPADVVDEHDRAAIGIDVADADDEVGVGGGRGDVQLGLHLAGPFDRGGKRLGGEGADFGLGFELLGVGRPREGDRGGHAVGIGEVGLERGRPLFGLRRSGGQVPFRLQVVAVDAMGDGEV